MIVRSKSFGEIEVGEQNSVYLPDGLLGFEELRRFAVVEREEWAPFQWLVSCDEPEIAFALADPRLFCAGAYEVLLAESDKDVLEWQPEDRVGIFVIVSMAEGGRRITANLKGPVVVNGRNHLGKQIVIYNPAFSVRQPLISQTPATTSAATPATARLVLG